MRVKVEPSGCVNRRGLVQVRFCFYLDAGDYRYDVHHIEVSPNQWQINPFHNHFIYVEPETTDDEIMERGKNLLKDTYAKWCRGEVPNLQNPPIKYLESVNNTRLKAVEDRVNHLQETILERKL